MAQLEAAAQMTLLELGNLHVNKRVQRVISALSQHNRLPEIAPWIEANGLTHHTLIRRLSEPSGSWRQANAGVATEATLTIPVVEPIARLEALSEVDESILDKAPDKIAVRNRIDEGFMGGLTKEFAAAVVYADRSTDIEKFNGLSSLFNGLSDTNVLGTGGTGSDLMSIWTVKFDVNEGMHFAYPSGHPSMGIINKDMGKQRVTDGTNPFYAYCSQYVIECALCIADNRSVYRVANIESSGSSNIFDDADMIDSLNTLLDLDGAAIFMNRTCHAQVDKDANAKTNVLYEPDTVFGRHTVRFMGVPIYLEEQLLITESALT